MKYNLHNKRTNEVVDTVDLASNVGITGARTYFLGIKRLTKKDFDKIWIVRTKSPGEYQIQVCHRYDSNVDMVVDI